ncbi:unnamed protein product [Clavelina lepadiformis]|uniref:Uncharacterized protein n=1 Tax=Clavelina lepadiformis TaxID=159417 RepID=A0ABP0GKX9_CLALP
MKLGDQHKCLAPDMVCNEIAHCNETLRLWTQDWNQNKKKTLQYPYIDSALRPVAHCPEISVLVFTSLLDLISDEVAMLDAVEDEDDNSSRCSNCSDTDSSTSSQMQSKLKPFT